MNSRRFIGILWALGGLALLWFAYRGETRNTPFLVIGVVLVALGGAIMRPPRRS